MAADRTARPEGWAATWFANRRGFAAVSLVLVILLGVTAWAISGPSLDIDSWWELLICWGIVGFLWVAYLVIRSIEERGLRWIRWPDLLVGIAMVIVLMLAATEAPYEVRLSLAKPGMTADARAVIAKPSRARRTKQIGTWPAEDVQTFKGGMRFIVPEQGWLDRVGFAYSPGGEPPQFGEDYYTDIGDGWWLWDESW